MGLLWTLRSMNTKICMRARKSGSLIFQLSRNWSKEWQFSLKSHGRLPARNSWKLKKSPFAWKMLWMVLESLEFCSPLMNEIHLWWLESDCPRDCNVWGVNHLKWLHQKHPTTPLAKIGMARSLQNSLMQLGSLIPLKLVSQKCWFCGHQWKR